MGTIDVVTGLLVLVGGVLGAITFVVTTGLGPVQLVATILVGGTLVMAGMLLGKALTGIAKTALYVYATEDTASKFFDDMDFSKLGNDETTSTGRINTPMGDSSDDRI